MRKIILPNLEDSHARIYIQELSSRIGRMYDRRAWSSCRDPVIEIAGMLYVSREKLGKNAVEQVLPIESDDFPTYDARKHPALIVSDGKNQHGRRWRDDTGEHVD